MMVIENKYNIGDIVYLITDPEQFPHIVTGISVRINSVMYELSIGESASSHYDFEISKEPFEITKGQDE